MFLLSDASGDSYQGTASAVPKRLAVLLAFTPCSQWLKPLSWDAVTARLKSCPDTSLIWGCLGGRL